MMIRLLTPSRLTTVCRRPQWRRLIPVAITGAIIASAVIAWNNGDWRLNLSPSEPMGLWSVQPYRADDSLHIGEIITFCPHLPAGYDYSWLGRDQVSNACTGGGTPYVKTIVAGPGDVVHEDRHGVTINGVPWPDSRPLPFTTSKPQLALPQWRGTITLKAGQYWAYGAGDPRFSFDSRYWGPFSRSQVQSVAHPIAVFKYLYTPRITN
jgi:conjugative transfer signal peptidase TraF